MRIFHIKNNNKACPAKLKRSGGFALLFSVLLSSLLLTIGLSIFSIALKELAISTASQRSVTAFYAADSGRECALYWDTKRGEVPNLFDKTRGDITCGYNAYGTAATTTLIGDYTHGSGTDLSNYTNVQVNFPTNIFVTGNPPGSGPNFNIGYLDTIGINKTLTHRGFSDQYLTTNVISTGHDSVGGDMVEREIREDY